MEKLLVLPALTVTRCVKLNIYEAFANLLTTFYVFDMTTNWVIGPDSSVVISLFIKLNSLCEQRTRPHLQVEVVLPQDSSLLSESTVDDVYIIYVSPVNKIL